MNSPVVLHTPRLVLRPSRLDDLEHILPLHADPEVIRYLYWEPRSREEVRTILEKRLATPVPAPENQALVLAVVERGGALVGEMTLIWRSHAHRGGEIGFVFLTAVHGRGYALEASEAVLRLAFERFGFRRIYGRCDARNAASARLMERLGMRREAHLVQNEFVKGEWTDEVVFAMLRSEWAQR